MRPALRCICSPLALLLASPLSAQTVVPGLWGPLNGTVTQVARSGNTVYFAGSFSFVGPSTGGGLLLDAESGELLQPCPRVAGIVRAIVRDGGGGWFIGGDFSGVEGMTRTNLAHVRADGTVSEWRVDVEDREGVPSKPADPNPVGVVTSLALKGNRLYVGGRFTEIGGEVRRYLAAVDARTGGLLDSGTVPDGPVLSMAIRANTLYIGGRFGTVSGVARQNLAAIDLRTGAPTPWKPDPDRGVWAIAFSGNTAYVGGEFDHLGGAARNSIGAVDLESGAALPWNANLRPLRTPLPHADWIWPFVASIVIKGSTLYAGGEFSEAGSEQRNGLAELDLVTGAPTSFDATLTGRVKALALHGATLYIGGTLYDVGGAIRPNLGAVDARTGKATGFEPRVYGTIQALSAGGGSVYAGGLIHSARDWVSRTGIVALDAQTGVMLPWNPDLAGGRISRMIGTPERLYIAGNFVSIDGQPRGHLASFDGRTGALTDWNPWHTQVTTHGDYRLYRPDPFRAMTLIGETIYAGGSFDQINGVPQRGLAAFDANSGEMRDWALNPRGSFPSIRGHVSALSSKDDTLFVAGWFDTIGTALRRDYAAVDANTGEVFAFDAQPGFYPLSRRDHDLADVRAMAANASGVFIGGFWYTGTLGTDRRHFTGFDASGALLPWHARVSAAGSTTISLSPVINDFANWGDRIIVGGRFESLGGVDVRNLAFLDAANGTTLEWNGNPDVRSVAAFDGRVEAMALYGDMLYVGGNFFRMGDYPAAGITAISLTPPGGARMAKRMDASPARVALAPPSPSPAREAVVLRFTLPAATAVTLTVYDLQGRVVAAPLRDSWLDAGAHESRLSTAAWRPGCYFATLDGDGVRQTQRLIVLR